MSPSDGGAATRPRRRSRSSSRDGVREPRRRNGRRRSRGRSREPRSNRRISDSRSRSHSTERRQSHKLGRERSPLTRPRSRDRMHSRWDQVHRSPTSLSPREDYRRSLRDNARSHRDYSSSPPSKRRRPSPSRSRSPPPRKRRYKSPSRSESPPPRRRKRSRSRDQRSRSRDRRKHDDNQVARSRKPLPSQEASFRGERGSNAVDKPIEKQKPNFSTTGLLAKEVNTVAGTKIVLKYHEPSEARKPPASQQWRLFIFKGDELLDTIHLYNRSCWLIGREIVVADLYQEHPSISGQHAVVQFRYRTKVNEFGDKKSTVRPYVIDLESSNGTYLNGERLEASRYFEVRDKDMVKLGNSEREYVFVLPPPEASKA